jgi:hypothetical protein
LRQQALDAEFDDEHKYLTKGRASGLGQMDGRSVYLKSVETKLRLSFSRGNNSIQAPCTVYIYQIWVKNDLALTKFTTPSVSTATTPDIESHIENQYREHYDQLSDRMVFSVVEISSSATTDLQRPCKLRASLIGSRAW